MPRNGITRPLEAMPGSAGRALVPIGASGRRSPACPQLVSSKGVCGCATNVANVKQRVSSPTRWTDRRKPTCICAKSALAPSRLGWMPKPWVGRNASSVGERHSTRSPVRRRLFTLAASAGQRMPGSSSIFAPGKIPSCSTIAKGTFSSSRCALTPKWRLGRMKLAAKRSRSSEEAEQMIQLGRANREWSQ